LVELFDVLLPHGHRHAAIDRDDAFLSELFCELANQFRLSGSILREDQELLVGKFGDPFDKSGEF
jgi:hypothetical protein